MDPNLADEIKSEWEAEEIPDEDLLFMRIHKVYLDDDGEPIPKAFRNHPPRTSGMSTDWQKYSTAEETRQRARVPADNTVIKFLAGAVRKIPGQRVVHTPDVERNNRAHTDVFGEKSLEARERFMRIYQTAPLSS